MILDHVINLEYILNKITGKYLHDKVIHVTGTFSFTTVKINGFIIVSVICS